ncbi:bidirectional sugar transporter SWEET5-like [Salvia hispanica]|uniref:bidirectional sugar transporter SWEET5-like n=1 Tax=Salvia hispanica TaxID=49212 RepID=UPI002009D70E|nr:bidirectional sugar transporter SWEET5-like [Salvia hispanica]
MAERNHGSACAPLCVPNLGAELHIRAGMVLELIYIVVFNYYTTHNNRAIMAKLAILECIIVCIVAAIIFHIIPSHATRTMVMGIMNTVSTVIMYASPMSILKRVVVFKDAKIMPIWTCLAGLCNSIIWFIYALLQPLDLYIAIPNGLGVAFGIVQLGVYAYYKIWAQNANEDQKENKDQKENEDQNANEDQNENDAQNANVVQNANDAQNANVAQNANDAQNANEDQNANDAQNANVAQNANEV